MDDRVVRSVAWDSDGTCLVTTTRGLSFWDGTSFRPAPTEGLSDPLAIRFIRRIGPARWLLACESSLFAIYTVDGVSEVTRFGDDAIQLQHFNGDLDDLAVAVGSSDSGPVLLTLTGRRWLKPVPLSGVAAVTGLARVEDARWIVAGRSAGGGGYAAVFSPLDLEVTALATPRVRAFLGCAGDPWVQTGLIGGAAGMVLWYQDGAVSSEPAVMQTDISAVAVDPDGCGWAAGTGCVMVRERSASGASWQTAWHDPRATAPVVSLFAHGGLVVAMTADAQILEGRRTIAVL